MYAKEADSFSVSHSNRHILDSVLGRLQITYFSLDFFFVLIEIFISQHRSLLNQYYQNFNIKFHLLPVFSILILLKQQHNSTELVKLSTENYKNITFGYRSDFTCEHINFRYSSTLPIIWHLVICNLQYLT